MRKKLKILGGCLAGAAVLWFWVWRDYSWDDWMVKHFTTTNCMAVATNMNVVYPERPWTIFKPVASGIWFIRTDSMVRFNDHYVLAKVIHIDREEVPDDSWEVFDCKVRRTAILADLEGLQRGQLEKLNWSMPKPKTPGEDIFLFVLWNHTLLPINELKP